GQDEAEIYCQKFRKWSVLTQWNECALAAKFRDGLSEAIKDVMVGFPAPTGLNESMTMAIQIDRRLRERKPVHHLAVSSEQALETMQCDRVQSRSERQNYRRKNGLCFYCGDSAHVISACSKRTKKVDKSVAISTLQSKFILSVTLICSLSSISVDAYVDSGAALSLMDWSFAKRCGFSLEPLEVPIPLKGIDSTPLAMNKPQYWTQVTMRMTPVHQESFMHDIFREYLDKFMIVYLDDILVFSDDWESHVQQVEVDASEIGAGAVLSQRSSDCSVMKPCAFFSRKFSPAERNYDVGNRELLAMKWAFEEWRHWLEGARHRVVVLTDHKNLIYLESARRLNPRQARWSLFFSRFNFVVSYLPGSNNVEPSDCPGVDMVVDRLHQIWSHVVDNLKLSQEKAQQFANRRRRVGPRLRVGDLVWLSSRFVPMKVSSPKFKPRFIGPYRILEILNPVSFRLDLLASFAIHNVFHWSLLRRYEVPVVPSPEPPAPVLVEGELEYVVEKILDSRVSRRKLQYLVKWKGYGQEDNSWVVASDVHADDLVRAFHRAHPGRPGGSREGSVTPPQEGGTVFYSRAHCVEKAANMTPPHHSFYTIHETSKDEGLRSPALHEVGVPEVIYQTFTVYPVNRVDYMDQTGRFHPGDLSLVSVDIGGTTSDGDVVHPPQHGVLDEDGDGSEDEGGEEVQILMMEETSDHQILMMEVTGGHQILMMEVTGGHQILMMEVTGSHQILMMEVMGGHQILMMEVMGGHQILMMEVTGGHQILMMEVTGSHQILMMEVMGGHQILMMEILMMEEMGGHQILMMEETGGHQILMGFPFLFSSVALYFVN
ncbi:unnamed protein product, partial [Ranitomeya imitator]